MPSSARKSVTSDGWMRVSTFGSFGPSSRPARRYAGIAEIPKRRAASPRTHRSPTVTASSLSVMAPFSLARPDDRS